MRVVQQFAKEGNSGKMNLKGIFGNCNALADLQESDEISGLIKSYLNWLE